MTINGIWRLVTRLVWTWRLQTALPNDLTNRPVCGAIQYWAPVLGLLVKKSNNALSSSLIIVCTLHLRHLQATFAKKTFIVAEYYTVGVETLQTRLWKKRITATSKQAIAGMIIWALMLLYLCLSAHISQKPPVQTLPSFLCMWSVIALVAPRGAGRGEDSPLWVDVQKLCNMCVLSLSWNFFVSHDKYIARPSSKEPRW